jgi:hypothetical protein
MAVSVREWNCSVLERAEIAHTGQDKEAETP